MEAVWTKVGRVQGGGIFFSTTESSASVDVSSVSPDTITPLSGDILVFPNGDVRIVERIEGSSVVCGEVVANLTGPQGSPGKDGEKGDPGSDGAPGKDAVITNELGNSATLAVSQKLLTEQLGNISTVLASLVEVAE